MFRYCCLLCGLWMLLLSGCNSDDEGSGLRNYTAVLIDSDVYREADSDNFHLEEAEITGDSLKVRIRYGGGCEEVKLQLVGLEEILDSDPPQRNIRLLFEDNDPCEALVAETFYFDLVPGRVNGSDRVRLILPDWDEPLWYVY